MTDAHASSPGGRRTWPRQWPRIRPLGERGAVLIEFVFILPVFLIGILIGGDIAYYVIVKQQVSYIARTTADNASRIGEDNINPIKQVSEADILDVLTGGTTQAPGLDIGRNGRIILSSLERNSSDGQWIHWQRCIGQLAHASTNGKQGDGASGTAFPGMGKTAIKAPAGTAIMFVEVAYRFQPLFGQFWKSSVTVTDSAAFRVREPRALDQVYNNEGLTPAGCGS